MGPRPGLLWPEQVPSHAQSPDGAGRSGEDRPPARGGAPLRSTACPHESGERGHPDKMASSADGGSTDTRAAGARPDPPAGPGLRPRPGRHGAGESAGGAEDSPRNFLGGLSRSPAAGSTTQRSSTNLRDEAASQQKEDPHLPRRPQAPGRPPKRPLEGRSGRLG